MKKIFGNGKKKTGEGSSSKRPRREEQNPLEEMEEEEEIRDANIRDGYYEGPRHSVSVANWESGPLCNQPLALQARMYKTKVGDASTVYNNMCCERSAATGFFRTSGFVEKLTAMGWEAVREFDDDEGSTVYQQAIVDWMATLTREDGRDPLRTTKLIGKVNGKKVVMSFLSLNQIAKFDSGPSDTYTFINEDDYWTRPERLGDFNTMMADLFTRAELKRDNLKPIVRLLHSFMVTNITPRIGDKSSVRKPEIPIMHAIMTGSPRYSFRQLAMMHIWHARNTKGKKLIPHTRLINAVLKKAKVVTPGEDLVTTRPQSFFNPQQLESEGWRYKKTQKWWKLQLKLQPQIKIKIPIWGVEPLQPGKVDELDSSDEEMLRRRGEGTSQGAGERSMPQPDEPGYSWGVFDDEMEQRVRSSRPPEYSDWESMGRALYDQRTRHDATRTREYQQLHDHVTNMARLQQVSFQHEVNMNYFDQMQRNRREAYLAGRPIDDYPPYVDYEAEPPYTPDMPVPPPPQPHHSMWLDPRHSWQHYQSRQPYQPPPQESQQPEDESQRGTFNFSSWYVSMSNIFGRPPGPSYY